jgi:hypothetical protein
MNTMGTSPAVDHDLQVTLDYTNPLLVAEDYILALVQHRDLINVHENIRTAYLSFFRRRWYAFLFYFGKRDDLSALQYELRRLELWMRIKGGVGEQATAKEYEKWCTDMLKIKS